MGSQCIVNDFENENTVLTISTNRGAGAVDNGRGKSWNLDQGVLQTKVAVASCWSSVYPTIWQAYLRDTQSAVYIASSQLHDCVAESAMGRVLFCLTKLIIGPDLHYGTPGSGL